MRLLERLNILALALAALSILAMSLAGGADVLATAAGRPIPAVHEATGTLMVMVVFLSLGHLQRTRGNIAIDILRVRLGPLGRTIHGAVVELIALVFFAVLAWQAWELAVASWKIREYSMGLVPFPVYPSKFAVAIGAGLTVLCAAARVAAIVRHGEPPVGTE